mgnify:CR=1 FL=1
MKHKIKFQTKPPPKYGKVVFQTKLASQLSLKNPVIEKMISILNENKLIEKNEDVWVRLCLDEIITNSIKHGNKNQSNKYVSITLYIKQNLWAAKIEDEGKGFTEDNLFDITSKEYLNLEHGRGILLIQNYMDEVYFYNNGSSIQIMRKKKNLLQKIWSKFLDFFYQI